MKRSICFVAILLALPSLHAITLNEWRFSQAIDASASGLVRVNLSAEALDAARPDLEDLRIIDNADQEVPYLIDRPMPRRESVVRPQELRTQLETTATKITLTTGAKLPLKGVMFEVSRSSEFVKAVQVEGSHDGAKWQRLVIGQPIFRIGTGATNLHVSFPQGTWEFLRLTIDDSRAPAVPFTGVKLDMAEIAAPIEPLSLTIKSRDESAGITRLAVDLGAANLTLASLRIETPDPLFTRPIRIAVPQLEDDAIRERTIVTGSIYRLSMDGKTEARLDVPIDVPIRDRELIVLIDNADSPPLGLSAVRCDRRLVRLVFFSNDSGRYRLLAGNNQCAAPRYDLSQLSEQLKSAAATDVYPSPLIANADYKAPDNLPAVSLTGAKIDIAAWKFLRPIEISKPGAQQLELDQDVLARAAPDLRDVRIVSEDRQLPFLFERPSISRTVSLTKTAANDLKKPTISRWSLKLQEAGVPITRLNCISGTALFQREMRLWEEVADERGDKFPRDLGRASWQRLPDQTNREFVIQFATPPRSDTLFLETDNGDNPPIEVGDFSGSYPVTRVIFKTPTDSTGSISLYYGNLDATSPRYDVNLIAEQLLRAERAAATLGARQSTATGQITQVLTGSARYIFWGVLALVVVALLFLISRLLPKAQ